MRTDRQWNPTRIAITITTLSVRILEGRKAVDWRRLDLQSRACSLEPGSETGAASQAQEKGIVDRESIIAVKHPTLELGAAVSGAGIHLDRPPLRASACTLALRFVMLSLSKAFCADTSGTKLCQMQLELTCTCGLQLITLCLIAHFDASARTCDLHAHASSCSLGHAAKSTAKQGGLFRWRASVRSMR